MTRSTTDLPPRLADYEGRWVNVALDDGSRIDGCQLVSAGRYGTRTAWLFVNGTDRFVPLHRIADVWEEPAWPCTGA
jgi:hypothetical protein